MIGDSSIPNLGLNHTYLMDNEEIKKEIQRFLEQGVIKTKCLSCGSPVLLMSKKDEGLHMCIDYREPNKITIKNQFPLLRIDDILDQFHGAHYFTNLDLKYGYH